MLKHSLFGLAIVAVGAVAFQGLHAAPPNDVAGFMRLKLPHAQKILEGIALEDYPLIAKSANELSLLSRETNWEVLQTPEYLAYSNEFRRATDAVSRAAKEKDIDGAALAYMDMTLKCVSCHKYVRDVRK